LVEVCVCVHKDVPCHLDLVVTMIKLCSTSIACCSRGGPIFAAGYRQV
jgi:hypothetical protein